MGEPQGVEPGLSNAFQPIEGIMTTARQPEQKQIEDLAVAGYRMVVDLRSPDEPRDFDEIITVIVAGMEYRNIPVTPDTVGYEDFNQFRELLDDAGRRPALVHCSNGSRVAGLLLAYLILDEGMSHEEAEDITSKIGPRNEVLEQAALRYVNLVSTG